MKNKNSFIPVDERMPMRKNLLSFLLFVFFFLGHPLSAQENYNALIYEGNQEFKDKNFDKASSQYLDALKINEKDFTAHYNLGNALYKKKQYSEAQAEYKKAESLAKSNSDKMAALYNQGNVAMQQKQPEAATELYKKALKLDPYNQTVRKNYEIAMLKNEEQQKQNNSQDSKEQNSNKQDNKEKNNGEEKQSNNPNKSSGGNQKQQQGSGKGEENEEKKNGESNGMPKDLQQAILDHVGEREKRTVQKILNKRAYSQPDSNEKDW